MKEWLIQLNDANGLGDQYEDTLLGYSSEGTSRSDLFVIKEK